MTYRLRARALATVALLIPAYIAQPALAGDATALPAVPVSSPNLPDPIEAPLTATDLSAADLADGRVRTSDSAALLTAVAGVSLNAAGGVSGIPAIHGLAADRVAIDVDGVPIGMACANEMNTPLSYIDPAQIGSAAVIAGITPVSLGGDSIGGTITVASPAPRFSSDGSVQIAGRASTFYRSNADTVGGALTATLAADDFALRYSGADVAARDYQGGGHDGKVLSSEYASANQALNLAWRSGTNVFGLDLSQQYIPRQGFPNQWMDMLYNRALHANGSYNGVFGWGMIEAHVYWQQVRHYMNFLADKGGSTETSGMPMDTRSETFGYTLKATINLSAADTLRVGSELTHQWLDDWWPAIPNSMMMGPLTYENIAGGRRTRWGNYGEWQRKWSGQWTSLLGVRSDLVTSNTGNVQPYSWTGMMNMADAMAAMAFNAAAHAKTDSDVDVTALMRYQPGAHATYEFGYAMKSRAPTLYERYAWGQGMMSSMMIGWFGDGNGYVGNLDLKPEVAHTLSATADWHGSDSDPWALKLTPYYTRIENYIGVQKLQDLMPGFAQLQFVNHTAELYGADLSGRLPVWNTPSAGQGDVRLTAGWVHGRDLTAQTSLYHLMPVNATLALDHRQGGWQGTAELVLVADKTEVDTLRNEPKTSGYALVNMRGSYTWSWLRLDAGIENLFDTAYALPLGGVSLGDYSNSGVLRPLPGMGRSFNVALTASL